MKIELKHLAPYLPYELKVYGEYEGLESTVKAQFYLTMTNIFDVLSNQYKPLLIPLTEENITEDDLEATSCHSRLRLRNMLWVNRAYHFQFEYMVSRHFDVFRLIDAGLALNKLENN